ncbi:MAG: hypothetical protein QOF04_438, partial [Solirubrobacteraceae bacterium]|nr:hypothetical protein [Solirubrobacteraceae bacterium]
SAVTAAGGETAEVARPASPALADVVQETTRTAGDAVAGAGQTVTGALAR